MPNVTITMDTDTARRVSKALDGKIDVIEVKAEIDGDLAYIDRVDALAAREAASQG